MKKIIVVIVILLLIVVCCSCEISESKFPNQRTKFVIDKIEYNKKALPTVLYYCNPVNQKDLNCSSLWFADKKDAFSVGDTISFCKFK